MVSKLLRTFGALAAVLMLTGCQKELVYGHRQDDLPAEGYNLRIRPDWSAVETAARPQAIHYDLFPAGSANTLLQYETGLTAYLDVRVPADTWQLLAYNVDTEAIWVSGDTWESTVITTRGTTLQQAASIFATTRVVPMARGTENQEIIIEPDMLWTGAHSGVTVSGLDDRQRALVPMQLSVQTIHFTIRHVSNLEYISAHSGTLSGMAKSMVPSTGRPSDTEGVVPFDMWAEGDSTMVGTVRTFGHCAARECEHKMCVYAILHDNSKWWYTFDVTALIHAWPYRAEELWIEVDGLPFPRPIDPTGGMQPVVDEWQEVKIDLPMK